MGCDWTIHIQALYDSNGKKWVTVHTFETKTRCGGNPIREALRQVVLQHQVKGDYGTEFPAQCTAADVEQALERNGYHYADLRNLKELEKLYDEDGSLKPGVELPASKKRKNTSDDSDEQAAAVPSPAEIMSKRDSLRLAIKTTEENTAKVGTIGHYSADEYFIMSQPDFQKFIVLIPRDENPCYRTLLEPLGRWTEMMKTANPYTGSAPWMDDEAEFIDGITEDIRALQAARQQTLGNFAIVAVKYALPTGVKNKIREYVVRPTPKDMRIAIFDDEHNSNVIRDGDLREPRCAIM